MSAATRADESVQLSPELLAELRALAALIAERGKAHLAITALEGTIADLSAEIDVRIARIADLEAGA